MEVCGLSLDTSEKRFHFRCTLCFTHLFAGRSYQYAEPHSNGKNHAPSIISLIWGGCEYCKAKEFASCDRSIPADQKPLLHYCKRACLNSVCFTNKSGAFLRRFHLCSDGLIHLYSGVRQYLEFSRYFRFLLFL